MSIGSMRHKVTLQRRGLVKDEGGGFANTWVDVVPDIWAEVKPMSANPVLIAAQPQQEITHRVTIRYRPDVTKKDRFVFRGRWLEIDNIINVDEAGKFLQIFCKENGV